MSGNNGPDGLSAQELQQAGPGGGSDYAYLDQTRQPHVPIGGEGDKVGSPTLNPAYYPAAVKPEALLGEGEKNGDEFPSGGTPDAKQEKATQANIASPQDVKEQPKQEQPKPKDAPKQS